VVKLVSREAVKPPEKCMPVLEEVSCEDCRFMREENTDGEEGYICLAHARRGINPRDRRECRRFLSAVERKMDFKEFGDTIEESDDYFDTKHLNNLMSGKDK
jgi:hypothetical protein